MCKIKFTSNEAEAGGGGNESSLPVAEDRLLRCRYYFKENLQVFILHSEVKKVLLKASKLLIALVSPR